MTRLIAGRPDQAHISPKPCREAKPHGANEYAPVYLNRGTGSRGRSEAAAFHTSRVWPDTRRGADNARIGTSATGTEPAPEPQPSSKPRRFYGSVEIDMVRPVKSFDAILNAVVMELQRTQGAKVKLTLEIEAEATGGFDDSEVSVVRDNAKQLKFKPESTGFEE